MFSLTRNGAKALATIFALATLSACNALSSAPGSSSVLTDTSSSDPKNPAPATYSTAVLLYNGTGVSTSDWQTTEAILQSQNLSYQLVNSAQLNSMTLDQISSFGVIIVPGGEGGTIASNLTAAAKLSLRQAVRDRGVGYVGFCAGAWVAVAPEATTNGPASYGFAVAPGSVLPAYYPNGNTSLTAAIVGVTFSNGSTRQMVWWGGPSTPEWTHGVIARYPDGTPAISETLSGKGYVVISGVHPEAPQSWRATAGTDSDGLDYDIAIEMIHAALTRAPLATY